MNQISAQQYNEGCVHTVHLKHILNGPVVFPSQGYNSPQALKNLKSAQNFFEGTDVLLPYRVYTTKVLRVSALGLLSPLS